MRSGCHEEYGRQDVRHRSLYDEECSSCHVVSQEGAAPRDHAGAVAGPLVLRASERELCLAACHEKEFAAPRRRRRGDEGEIELREHGPVQEGRCSACHRAHETTRAALLRGNLPAGPYATYSRATYSACLDSCHPPELVEEEPTKEATRFRNGDENLHFVHVAGDRKGRSCELCHAPHLAANRALMRDSMPFGGERLTLEFVETEQGGSCTTTCHIPAAYDREKPVPCVMRTQDLRPLDPGP